MSKCNDVFREKKAFESNNKNNFLFILFQPIQTVNLKSFVISTIWPKSITKSEILICKKIKQTIINVDVLTWRPRQFVRVDDLLFRPVRRWLATSQLCSERRRVEPDQQPLLLLIALHYSRYLILPDFV